MGPNEIAGQVLAHFPLGMAPGKLIPLGNAGGFSGAGIWRWDTTVGCYCLRAWPEGKPPPKRLQQIHSLMESARTRGLGVIPALERTRSGGSWQEHDGRLWELTTWMPGRADFHERPTFTRLCAALTTLARLHSAWEDRSSTLAVCPAIERRWKAVEDWRTWVHSGWRPRCQDGKVVQPWAERAWFALGRWWERLPTLLEPWMTRKVQIQPCLCDIWHDHVLFTGDEVTGLIDFGAVKLDNIAVDVARLVGSLVGEDVTQTQQAFDAYRSVRPITEEEAMLAAVLDQTGTILGTANWLKWLYRDGRSFDDLQAVADRLRELVLRMEKLATASW